MAGTVVVGVDGSSDSGIALRWAAAEAADRGDALHILFGLHMPVVSVPFGRAMAVPPVPELEARVRLVLSAAADVATAVAPGLDVSTTLAIRQPADALIDASTDASLVVVGSRGLSGLGAAFLGSVSARVAANSACPTVVIPPETGGITTEHDEPAAGDADPATAPIVTSGPIVVGVDGSSHSDAALRFALDEARRRGTSVVAVFAYQIPMMAVPVIDPVLVDQLATQERQRAEATVADALERARTDAHAGVAVEARIVAGHPADAVVDAGRGGSMTVVGSRGRSSVRGLLLGSVSQAVLHQATHPVVVIHAPAD